MTAYVTAFGPAQTTTRWVEPSSTGGSRLRDAPEEAVMRGPAEPPLWSPSRNDTSTLRSGKSAFVGLGPAPDIANYWAVHCPIDEKSQKPALPDLAMSCQPLPPATSAVKGAATVGNAGRAASHNSRCRIRPARYALTVIASALRGWFAPRPALTW
jgi:hypothetical protein